MGRALAPVEQARGRELEGAGAHREHAAAAGRGLAQDVEDLGVEGAVDRTAGDGDEVGVAGRLERERRDDPHAARRAQHLAGTGRADPEVERRHAVVGAVDAEDLAQDAELEQWQRAPGRGRRWCAASAQHAH